MVDWPDYYAGTDGRSRRPLIERAVEIAGSPGTAVDLGSGSGLETLYLLENGWQVVAVDGEPDAARRLEALVPREQADRLDVRIVDFRDLDVLPPANLVHASLSLPFCPPASFDRLWAVATSSLRLGGLIAADLFGDRDTWAQEASGEMTFHTRADVDRLLEGLDVVAVDELEHDRPAYSGPKHWHVFQVFARRPA